MVKHMAAHDKGRDRLMLKHVEAHDQGRNILMVKHVVVMTKDETGLW